VASLIQRRLERLSSRALVLAQVAAVARAQFSLPLAARMLRQGSSELRGAVRELEEAQVLLGERFSHDLVQEAVEAAVPAPMKGLLHGLLAALLEEDGAPPILIAHHWMQAEEPARALPQLLRAASAGEEVMLPQEAADLYARAAHLLSEAGRHEDAARVRERERRCRLAVKPAPEGLA
jgi:predicted ATPase